MTPSPDEEWHFNTCHLGRRVLVYNQVASTNDVARTLAESPGHFFTSASCLREPAGTVIIARHQTAGRGQYGRTWLSRPDSSLLASILIAPTPHVAPMPILLTAWVGIALVNAVRELAGIDAQLKWPNDLLVSGRKLAGILIEQTNAGTIVGIGMNLTQTAEELTANNLAQATSLAILSKEVPHLRDCLSAIIRNLEYEYEDIFVRNQWRELESSWIRRLDLTDRLVDIHTSDTLIRRAYIRSISFEVVCVEWLKGGNEQLHPSSIRSINIC